MVIEFLAIIASSGIVPIIALAIMVFIQMGYERELKRLRRSFQHLVDKMDDAGMIVWGD